jgi:hypothetical protein
MELPGCINELLLISDLWFVQKNLESTGKCLVSIQKVTFAFSSRNLALHRLPQ